MEQLTHPVFRAEFPKYLMRKIVAAREDEAFFAQSGETHYAETARFWHRFFTQALDDFQTLGGNIVAGFRRFHEAGTIEIVTCAATHGYLPLLGTDESIRAQLATAVETHIRHIGEAPRGIWVPECGYRPAGMWSFPVQASDGSALPGPVERIGVEQALREADLNFFFVDTHLVEESDPVKSPYARAARLPGDAPEPRSLYRPWLVAGPSVNPNGSDATTAFVRDPRTGLQVWSGEIGYPGDGVYCDFHKKRWPGGHRYWRVTGPHVDMANKEPYYPQDAAARVQSHASHFVHLVYEALKNGSDDGVPPIVCAPFDAELFGHWWFEGPLWLEAVARILHEQPTGIELTSASDYLADHAPTGFVSMREGSWGTDGGNQVWLNQETGWTYSHLYPAEVYLRQVCGEGKWRDSQQGGAIVKQMCRELLLLESSDWQFLITTGAARDYAELRFLTHNEQFLDLKTMWQAFEQSGSLNDHQAARLEAIAQRDSVFPNIDPGLWATYDQIPPSAAE